jgi:hypothetical protein
MKGEHVKNERKKYSVEERESESHWRGDSVFREMKDRNSSLSKE